MSTTSTSTTNGSNELNLLQALSDQSSKNNDTRDILTELESNGVLISGSDRLSRLERVRVLRTYGTILQLEGL